jgi:hypothetical protein
MFYSPSFGPGVFVAAVNAAIWKQPLTENQLQLKMMHGDRELGKRQLGSLH